MDQPLPVTSSCCRRIFVAAPNQSRQKIAPPTIATTAVTTGITC
jgi:hypothetical protein